MSDKQRINQLQYEKALLKEKLGGFDPKSSIAWTKLTDRYGPKISLDEMLSLAQAVSSVLNVPLTREYKRRKDMLIKWFDEHFDVIWPFIEENVFVEDINGKVINYSK